MQPARNSSPVLLDLHPPQADFRADVVRGLQDRPRTLSAMYFYDQAGSKLFDRICELDEYYPTRTEMGILTEFMPEIVDALGSGVMLVEYGSGSSTKTTALLDRLDEPVAYVPVDISREHLSRTAVGLAAAFPHIEVLPVAADFT